MPTACDVPRDPERSMDLYFLRGAPCAEFARGAFVPARRTKAIAAETFSCGPALLALQRPARERARPRARARACARMPLHASDPIARACPLDGFDDSVRSARSDSQALCGLQNCLMVRAVDFGFAAAAEFGQARIRFDARQVMRLRLAGRVMPGVLDLRWVFAGNVLNQRAAKKTLRLCTP